MLSVFVGVLFGNSVMICCVVLLVWLLCVSSWICVILLCLFVVMWYLLVICCVVGIFGDCVCSCVSDVCVFFVLFNCSSMCICLVSSLGFFGVISRFLCSVLCVRLL